SKEEKQETKVESKEAKKESKSEPGITGAIVSEEKNVVKGVVSKEKDFNYIIEEDETASLILESVAYEGEKIGDDKVKLNILNSTVRVTTDYSVIEKGFGKEYIGNNKITLEIDLTKFNISAENGIFSVKVLHSGNEIVSAEKRIAVSEAVNESILNETASNESAINQTIGNKTILTNHGKIRLGERVKWTKNVSLEMPENVTIELPKEAENISVKKIDNEGERAAAVTINGVTGNVISGKASANLDIDEINIMKFFRKTLGALTGRAITEIPANNSDIVEVILADNATEYTIEYYTDAPFANETNTSFGKEVIISGPDGLNYTDVISFANIPELYNVGDENRIRIYWKEGRSNVVFNASDSDNNGKLDYVEWVTPHLSSQTFNIILITKAEHLNENRTFVEDVYNYVRARDGNFTNIPANNYIRVTFEKNLTSNNDITIYARAASNTSNASVQVYEKNASTSIADFGAITEDQKYRILLTSLQSASQDVFDLKVLGDAIEFDYIVDPAAGFNISFVSPTPANASTSNQGNATFNVSITNITDLRVFLFQWNGTNDTIINITNFTLEFNVSLTSLSRLNFSANLSLANISFYDDSLVLMLNFDNVSDIGDNETYVRDQSKYGNNLTLFNGATYNNTGRYRSAGHFDGVNNFMNATDSASLDLAGNATIALWIFTYSDPTSGGEALVSKRTRASDTTNYHLYFDAGRAFRFYNGVAETVFGYVAPDNQFVHLALVMSNNSGTMQLYVNGAQNDTKTVSQGGVNNGEFWVGFFDAAVTDEPFNGSIDALHIWNRTLNATEISLLYRSNLRKYTNTSWTFTTNQSALGN
ncbi:MAG: LamG domain-containing protein, partial [Nanoarchaeota archaeon]